ncbi:MAG: zinc ribbon domain-containing protein [Anaerolineae bacterium]|nr:zinc ribbon domain-containing protein [Anaerolineae bacterium]
MPLPQVVPHRCPQCGAPLPRDGVRITCAYCGSSLICRATPSATPFSDKPRETHFKTLTCVDHQGIGIKAFRLLIPAQWEFEGSVHWLLNNPGMPAAIAFRAHNPQGDESSAVLSHLSRYWTDSPRVISRTSAQIGEMMMESYYQRQETMKRPATQLSQAIRGRTSATIHWRIGVLSCQERRPKLFPTSEHSLAMSGWNGGRSTYENS